MISEILKVDWFSVIQTIAVIYTAFIAHAALHTWKHQTKAQKQTDFLDELTDLTHEYIQSLAQPVQLVKFIHIGFECYKPTSVEDSKKQKNANVIAYISARGEEDSTELWELLNENRQLRAKIQSLVAKGQVYGFMNFNKCQDAIKMLLWQHERLQVVASMVGAKSLNLEHPKVIKAIDNMLTVKPEDIDKHLKKHNMELLNFVQENFQTIFKGT